MNTNTNSLVKIVADFNFKDTELNNASGVVMKKNGSFFQVLVTSGKFIGQKHNFLEVHLQNL